MPPAPAGVVRQSLRGYSLSVNGAHRSTTQRPTASALKSAAWLLTGAALVTVPLALLGLLVFGVYLAIVHPADAVPVAIAAQGAAWVSAFGHLTWTLFRDRPPSPARLTGAISDGCLLLGFTMGLLSVVGDQLGWAHGPFRYAMAGVGAVLLIAVAAYWLIGQHALRAFLEARTADRETPGADGPARS
jgi:hypothetical protein